MWSHFQGNRRQAPPPPPPLQSRRTQPNLIRELAVAAERKATLRSLDRNSVPKCTPPETTRQIRSVSDTTTPGGTESEGSADGSPHQERKGKVPMLPNTSRTALQPKSYPAPPPPVPGNKATPTSETPHVQETTTKTTPTVDSDAVHKAAAPPPIAVKPKKKKQTSNEDLGEPEPSPQTPPTKLEAAVPMAVDMDSLMEEAVALEPPTKKARKKVKKKESSEDSTAGEKKEKK